MSTLDHNKQTSTVDDIEHVSITVEGDVDFPLTIPVNNQTIKAVSDYNARQKKLTTLHGFINGLKISLITSVLTASFLAVYNDVNRVPKEDNSLDGIVKVIMVEGLLLRAALKCYEDNETETKTKP